MNDDLAWWANWSNIIGLIVSIISLLFAVIVWYSPKPPVPSRLSLMIRKALPIIMIIAAYWLGASVTRYFEAREIIYNDVVVTAGDPEFVSSNLFINSGDTVDISFLDPRNEWTCLETNLLLPSGDASFPLIPELVFPNANLCELIGFIEEGHFIAIGSRTRFVADRSGILFLGNNDIPAERCGIADPNRCYRDNTGRLHLRITVIRK
jgi:hypothetical protein